VGINDRRSTPIFEGITSIEEDINFFSTRKGLIFVTNTGNQGSRLTHGYGRFLKSNSLQTQDSMYISYLCIFILS